MHAKPDLRVFLKWMITRSGSVITDVIRLRGYDQIRETHRLDCLLGIRYRVLGLQCFVYWVLLWDVDGLYFGGLSHIWNGLGHNRVCIFVCKAVYANISISVFGVPQTVARQPSL